MNKDYYIDGELDVPVKPSVDEDGLKKKFGQLMTRFAIVQSIIKEYDDECKAIQKEIDDLMKGVIDGKSVQ